METRLIREGVVEDVERLCPEVNCMVLMDGEPSLDCHIPLLIGLGIQEVPADVFALR